MSRIQTIFFLAVLTLCFFQDQKPLKALELAEPPMVEKFLLTGELEKGKLALEGHLKNSPDDDEARFGLGTLQFLQSVERMSQSFYKYGLLNQNSLLINQVPFLRIAVEVNPNPELIDYEKFRAIFHKLLKDLQEAEQTLSQVKSDDVKLRLHFGIIRLDLNGDGKTTEEELLVKIYARFNQQLRFQRWDDKQNGTMIEAAKKFAIAFDKADVYWLQGYCNLLMAFDQFYLAHDWKDSFERTGHLFFPKKKESFPFLKKTKGKQSIWNEEFLADIIAFVHLLGVDVVEKKRLASVVTHLEKVIQLSRLNFKSLQAEKDDSEEWIPNSSQTGVMPGVRVTQKMIDDWHVFLDEFELILDGKKLIPHWRLKKGLGFNLKTFFQESKRFDIVLLSQGTDIGPYVEKGELTEPQIWRELQRTFGGNFFGFAVWFN